MDPGSHTTLLPSQPSRDQTLHTHLVPVFPDLGPTAVPIAVSFRWAVPKACSVSAWLEGRLGAMGITGSHVNTAVLLTLPQCFGDTLRTHYTPSAPEILKEA